MGTCCQTTAPQQLEKVIETNENVLNEHKQENNYIQIQSPLTPFSPNVISEKHSKPYKKRAQGSKNDINIIVLSESDIVKSPPIESEQNNESIEAKWKQKYKQLQETLDKQNADHETEIQALKAQLLPKSNIKALKTEIQALKLQKLDYNMNQSTSDQETNAMKQQIETLKKENNELKLLEKGTFAHSDTMQSLKMANEEIKRLQTEHAQIIHEPHAKPSFHKKTEEKQRLQLATKNKEIKALKEELNTFKTRHTKLENELRSAKDAHDALITRTKTMNSEEIESLQNRLQRIHSQHTVDKESYQKELQLLKEKDPGFIEKLFKQRDEFKTDLLKLKKLFKERELTLKLELEQLERRKIKAEDLADLKDKNEDELREIIEKLRYTNRDLNVTLREDKRSADKREQEYEEQISGLNKMIKDSRPNTKRSSKVSKLSALGALSVSTPIATTRKSAAKQTNFKFGGIAASLAGKLPFGEKKKEKAPLVEVHKDEIKGKIAGLLAKKEAESGQGPITDDTKSILGMIDTMQKYQKMKKIGMPMSSIKNKMKLDGFNDTQIAKFAGETAPKPLNGIDLTQYNLSKYSKMKKIGLPQASVRNKMKMDGFNSKVIATFFGEKLHEEEEASAAKIMQPPSKKPDIAKYSKMIKIGMPQVSVRNKMKIDGLNEYWIRDFFGEAQPIIGGSKIMEAPCAKPDVTKYTKMKKVKLPINSIKNKMKKDGIDPYWIRDFFNESQPIIEEEQEREMQQPCDKPDFSKYERMKKVGLPTASIRNKMIRDKIHKYWICVFFGEAIPKIKSLKKKKKQKRAVKPLHWRKKSECDWSNTIWAQIEIHIELKVITTQTLITAQLSAELEKAFTSNRAKNEKKKGGKKKKDDESKEITLIPAKRAFNMIVGLRQFEKLNITDLKIRNYLLKLDDSHLTAEMLENLAKFVPNNDELVELRNFKGKKERLARGERFVDMMTCLVDIKMRIDLWQFKIKFKENVFEIESRVNKITHTLNTLKTCPQIAAFLKICLIIGNFMNEGTNRGAAKGIKLESIDRFASMKTADNKRTMLMFILDHIEKNKLIANLDDFPHNLAAIVEESKKIEAKTIRDGINDMHDSLERIGKRITRAARHLHQIQAHFHKSAGNALKVLGKLRQNASKLHDNKRLKRTPKVAIVNKKDIKLKKISFVDDLLLHKDSDDEKFSKYRTKKKKSKPRKFIIIDANYKGRNKIRTRKERDDAIAEQIENSEDDIFTRGETMIESDADFSDFEAGESLPFKVKKKSKHEKHETGLRRKKRKLKKVKIRRMYRVGKKSDFENLSHLNSTSRKTMHTIRKLRETKRSHTNLLKHASIHSHARGLSIVRKTDLEDPHKIPDDKFESVMTGFHTMACNKVEALNKEFKNLKIFAGSVAVYFGEHDDLEWEQLFQMFLIFFEQISKAKKLNHELRKKKEKLRKKQEREKIKKERMAKKGLKPKPKNGKKSQEPTNILEEIKMKNAKGTLTPSKAKKDIVGFENV